MASTPKRRKLSGRPLLVASAAAVLAGCGGGKSDPRAITNPIVPPQVTSQVCLDVEPPDATVTLTGTQPIVATQRCTEVTSFGSVEVTASAPGWATHTRTLSHTNDGVEAVVQLQPDSPPPPPVGNLVAPPQVQVICVDAEPSGAMVRADGVNSVVFTKRCAEVDSYGLVVVSVSKLGFETVTKELGPSSEPVVLAISLVEHVLLEPPPPPMGNLMPPPDPEQR